MDEKDLKEIFELQEQIGWSAKQWREASKKQPNIQHYADRTVDQMKQAIL